MGYSRAQKQDNHEKIVAIAATRFREQGLDGLSVAALMQEAGLTHGGFYSHFTSRDDMVAQALAHAFSEDEGRLSRAMKRRGGPSLQAFLEVYLSPAHRDTPGQGCTLAAVACEAARKGDAVKALFSARVEGYSERLAPELGISPARMVTVLSAATGALVLSRAVGDRTVADNILASTRRELLAR
ncbi:TetR/AcrR family transcriptional regulator [Kordiimonas sp.]|uniref:TetR/AcrR family transcriptional regulator n=1 Tax=Kordiimonas sp. TaxID=1970157 RepID=UPI003A9310AD